jgi:hypothetical protein
MEQYGFRTKLTTENATYNLTNEVVNAMNNRLIVGGMFCDLKKAFDCVNHDILLSKLQIYGRAGKDKEHYQSYHKGRHQRVSIYNKTHHYSTLSNWALIKHGVPQGSIIGPLLFLLYMNDLPKCINDICIPILFADDTSILFTHFNIAEFHVNNHAVLDIVNTWFKENFLSINFEKTHYIRFRT